MGRYIDIKTEIPGPKSREFIELHRQYVADALELHVPCFIDRGRGALLTDVDGNTFIDLSGGIGVLNVGHSAPDVVDALKEHIDRFLHTDFTIVPYDSLPRLARELCRLAPGSTPKRAAFFNSGAEAVENAVKIAKVATGRYGFIAFEGAFHGRTLMAMSLTSKPSPYKKGYGPFATGVERIPYAYCYRCPMDKKYPDCNLACADFLERAFVTRVAPEECAAVVVEPVQGEGGFVVPPAEYLTRIREICDKHDVLLIVDEIQTGFGRTGKMFASEWSDIEPDMITVAKSIAAGIPLSGVVGKEEIMNAPGGNTIGGTYVGNPLGCTAGLAVIRMIEEENLIERANRLGGRLKERLETFKEKYEIVGDVRGRGAMCAMELVRDRRTKEPASAEVSQVMGMAIQRGLVPLKAGIYGNVIRFLVSLVIEEDQLDEALDVMEECVKEVNDKI